MEEYKAYTIADVRKEADKKKFNVISTFAGGGGSSIGYKLAGGHILCVNEFVEEARTTYSSNFPDTQIIPDDIKQLSGQDFLDATGLKAGELDILDGSPPCSAFSLAGKRDKGWNSTKKYSDGKNQENIEDLFLEFARIAEVIQPKVIIAENVKGIMMGTSIMKLNEFLNKFESIGYIAAPKVLSAVDFGVAQKRERTILICVRKDVMEAVGLNILTVSSVFPQPTTGHVSLNNAIKDIVNDPDEVQELLDFVQGGYQKKFLEPLPFNPKKTTKPSDKENLSWNPKASCFNMIRPCPDLPSPTLTAMGQKRGLSGVFHPASNRKLTVKELKRVMGLPDDYVVTGTFDQRAERIGRMVAPKMMCEVAKSVYENVIKPYNDLTK